MIQEGIGEVRLRVRTDVPDASEIRPAAERMVRAVLERCAAEIETRMPGRIVLVRRLPLLWRIDESLLDDAEQVKELARAAADAIERMAGPRVLDPPPESGAVIFEDEPHLRAGHLLALARGQPAWFHASLEEDLSGIDPWAELAAPEQRPITYATLRILARAGVLAEVLASWPASAVAVFAAAIGCNGHPVAQVQSEPARVAELAEIAATWPPLAGPARTLALRIHAAVMLDAELPSPAPAALAAAVMHSSAGLRGFPAYAREERESAAVAVAPEEPAEPEEPAAEAIPTRCAGLFYLLDRIQELDLGESLWKSCLPEGAVLAAAASALLGPTFAPDPAPALFGGVPVPAVSPEVTAEQHAEIAIATCAALAQALPRRGLSNLPPVFVSLHGHAAGRLLVAAAEGSPFAFFTWSAAAPQMLRAGLRALLDAWPHRGLLAAPPALCALDTTGRLRPRSDALATPLFFPTAPLPVLVVGASCTLFAARARMAPLATAEQFVTRFFAHQGTVRLTHDRMDIILSEAEIDLDARRAGLDRDPGWIPWLRRTVRFIFEEPQP
jgi:hypothetical protein